MKWSEEKNEFEAEYDDLTDDEKQIVDDATSTLEKIVKIWNKADKRVRKEVL